MTCIRQAESISGM